MEVRLVLWRAPYVIFHDSTLLEMFEEKPNTLEALSHISGVGQAKLKKYGDDFLSVLINES